MTYNVLLVLGVQQSDSVLYTHTDRYVYAHTDIHMSILFHIIFHTGYDKVLTIIPSTISRSLLFYVFYIK